MEYTTTLLVTVKTNTQPFLELGFNAFDSQAVQVAIEQRVNEAMRSLRKNVGCLRVDVETIEHEPS